jgi:hypothetical protein
MMLSTEPEETMSMNVAADEGRQHRQKPGSVAHGSGGGRGARSDADAYLSPSALSEFVIVAFTIGCPASRFRNHKKDQQIIPQYLQKFSTKPCTLSTDNRDFLLAHNRIQEQVLFQKSVLI